MPYFYSKLKNIYSYYAEIIYFMKMIKRKSPILRCLDVPIISGNTRISYFVFKNNIKLVHINKSENTFWRKYYFLKKVVFIFQIFPEFDLLLFFVPKTIDVV